MKIYNNIFNNLIIYKFNLIVIRLLLLLTLFSTTVYSQNYIDSNLNEAQIEINSGKCEGAIQKLNGILVKQPDHYLAWIKKAYCESVMGKNEVAFESYKKANEISYGVESLLGLQYTSLMLLKYDESIKYGFQVLEINPINYFAKLRLMYAYLYVGKNSEAEDELIELVRIYGKSAELTYLKGLIRYNQNEKEDSIDLFKTALKMDPNHEGAKYYLQISGAQSDQFSIKVDYGSVRYSTNSVSSFGASRGAIGYATLFQSITIGLGYRTDTFTNLTNTSGVKRYFLDEYNLLTQALYLQNPSDLISYYQSPYNTYKLFELANSGGGLKFSDAIASIQFQSSPKTQIRVIGHRFQGNSNLVNGGTMVGFQLNYGLKDKFNIGGARIVFPKSNGYQISSGYLLNFLDNFFSYSEIFAQTMNIKTYDVETIYLGAIYLNSKEEFNRSNFGAFQQTISYIHKLFAIGIGGRIGRLYTPLFDEIAIYNPAEFRSGAFGYLTIIPDLSTTITLSYSKDNWKNGYGETPSSSLLKILATWSY
jgi:tetratricopeptide (TPR) repeat protein